MLALEQDLLSQLQCGKMGFNFGSSGKHSKYRNQTTTTSGLPNETRFITTTSGLPNEKQRETKIRTNSSGHRYDCARKIVRNFERDVRKRQNEKKEMLKKLKKFELIY
jgi:hypothetical protein